MKLKVKDLETLYQMVQRMEKLPFLDKEIKLLYSVLNQIEKKE
jgi:hypothetical protein